MKNEKRDVMNARSKRRFVRLVVSLVAVTLVTGQTGCVGFNRKQSAALEQPPEWDRVGVISVAVEPNLKAFNMPRTHNLLEDKTVQGSAAGAATGAAAGLVFCSPSTLFPPAYAICVAAVGVSGLFLGFGVGKVVQNKKNAESTFAEVPKGTAVQDVLREKVMVSAQHETAFDIVDLGAYAPPPRQTPPPSPVNDYEHRDHSVHFDGPDQAKQPEYGLPQKVNADVILEVTLREVLARGLGGWADQFEIKLTSGSRLVRVSDGSVLADRTHYYKGPVEGIGGSAAEQTVKIRRSVRIGIETLAHDIVMETLLGRDTRAPWTGSGHPEFMD